MACRTLLEKAKTCLNNIGGLKTIFMTDQDSITGYTLDAGLKKLATLTYTEAWLPVYVKRNTSNLKQSEKRNLTEGTN